MRDHDDMVAEVAAIAKLMKVLERDSARTSSTTTGESIRRLATEGDPEAAAYLAHFASDENRQFETDLDSAVEADLHWTKEGNVYSAGDSPIQNPEDLVKAYRARQVN